MTRIRTRKCRGGILQFQLPRGRANLAQECDHKQPQRPGHFSLVRDECKEAWHLALDSSLSTHTLAQAGMAGTGSELATGT